jgi:hypothetical protein
MVDGFALYHLVLAVAAVTASVVAALVVSVVAAANISTVASPVPALLASFQGSW